MGDVVSILTSPLGSMPCRDKSVKAHIKSLVNTVWTDYGVDMFTFLYVRWQRTRWCPAVSYGNYDWPSYSFWMVPQRLTKYEL
jgi:hypothetical protein